MPYHTHTVNGGSHTHGMPGSNPGLKVNGGNQFGLFDTNYKNAIQTSPDGGHTHSCSYAGNSSTWNNGTNKNMPAYITCYIWRRTA